MKINSELAIKRDMDELRQELYNLIEKEEVNSEIVRRVSCKLDNLILKYYCMKRKQGASQQSENWSDHSLKKLKD